MRILKNGTLNIILVILCFVLCSCSLKADYKRTIYRKVLGIIDLQSEIEINCQSKKARSIIYGSPIKTMDGIEAVSQDWIEIDRLADHALQELHSHYKEDFIIKPLMISEVNDQATSFQSSVKAEYNKVCK